MTELLLAAAPVLLILCLAGFGAAPYAWLRGQRPRDANILDAAFLGLFLVTAGALVANFFVGFGTEPAAMVATIGLVLFVVVQWRRVLACRQFALLLLAVAAVSVLAGDIVLSYDAGLYHLSAMNWIAYAPAPLGLANLHGRLGFDSAWLLFQSAFRSERVLQWSHLAISETALRALVLAWVVDKGITALRNAWQARALLYLAALVILLFIVFQAPQTSTDMSANLLAFCAWLVFCDLVLADDQHTRGADAQFVLLLVLSGLAVTFKLSMLPIALLPGWLLLSMARGEGRIVTAPRLAGMAVVALYGALWLARNFVLSGCVVYPVAMTCASVPWGTGAAQASHDAAGVLAWGRHPSPGALNYLGFFNVAWVPEWLGHFGSAIEFKLVGAALTFALLSGLFGKGRDRLRDHAETRELVRVSVVCAVVGIALWYIAAPVPRFSRAFFAMLAATMAFRGLVTLGYTPPTLAVMPATRRGRAAGSLAGCVAVVALRLYFGPALVEPPIPPSKRVSVSAGRTIFMPTSGDQCWNLFPCTPYDFGSKSFDVSHGRYVFRSGRARD